MLLCFAMVSANAVADLGVSLDYNIFVEQNLTSQNSQSNGRVAAGGNVTLNGYGVATVVSVPAQGAALLVGNDLSFSNGRVYHGGILAGGDVSGVNAAVVNGLVAGATIQGSAQLPFSFQTEFNNLRAISNTLSAAETNGQVEYLYGGVRISGDCSSNIQVFNIDAAQLKTSNHIVINCVPSGATVVFNVSGISNPSMMNMGFDSLIPFASNLVWNFHGATSLSFANVAVPGLILAPTANINTTWGAISGTVIGKSWTGSFSLEHRPFTGNLLPLLQQAPADSDNDGVPDAIDICPGTSLGETVNDVGCAFSQLDTDTDGVDDSIDQCPATPQSEIPDAQGCSQTQLDNDNDGVNDALDQCPATPQSETPNAEGCSLSQLDADSDGISDAVDICPNTPNGESANSQGCSPNQLDSDNDGVNDAVDICSETPVGEQINAVGCALSQLDIDVDGVNDAIDLCLSTPLDEQVNSDGCALSQLDTDSDGVSDAVDQCPVTPEGELANAQGCSPDQIDSDNDGTPDYLDAFPNDPSETFDLDGDGIGDNADSDRDGDGVENSVDAFPNDPDESVDTDGDGVGDNSDPDIDGDGVNNDDDFFPTDPESSSVPSVQITSPATLITVGSSPLRISGTVDDLDATLIVNGIEIPQNNGSFEADVVIEEGANNIIVRAIDSKNHEGTATISVSLDKTPPYITIQSPENGSKVFSDIISVSGLVNDIVRGTVSADEANVQVTSSLGSVSASVSNRSYLAENVRLQTGENVITIAASDAVGNSNSETINVTYEPQTNKVIELISGNAQTAVIQTNVAQPLAVQLTENGQPVVDKTVIFRVTEGDGLLQPGTEAEGNGAVVKTNAQGQAQVTYKLGSRAGTGNHKVMSRAVGFKGEVLFYQSASYGDGIQMGIIAGNNQRGAVRQPLPQPLVLAVTDDGANLIPNAEVEFLVNQGSGRFSNGETTFTTTTDLDGRASANFVLGAEEGLDIQRVTAKLIGTESTAGFTASGLMPGDPAQTSISGVVLDNQDQPLPGVTIRIEDSTRQAVSDEQGQFTITETPVGPVHLLVEGSTTSVVGEWPSLSYNLVTVPGADNPLPAPIFLVKIDTENAVFVGREDKVVTHPELPGFELKVKAGSVTFPDGSKEGNLSITRVNANKIPMPPPNGMQPQLIVTIQPHGAMFDPPARLTLPNTDAHSPLAEIEMYSFDHDLEEFVTIGLGTVSKDGSTVTSNLGSGVIKAGWHCGSAPVGNGCCIDCAPCWEKADSGSCGCEQRSSPISVDEPQSFEDSIDFPGLPVSVGVGIEVDAPPTTAGYRIDYPVFETCCEELNGARKKRASGIGSYDFKGGELNAAVPAGAGAICKVIEKFIERFSGGQDQEVVGCTAEVALKADDQWARGQIAFSENQCPSEGNDTTAQWDGNGVTGFDNIRFEVTGGLTVGKIEGTLSGNSGFSLFGTVEVLDGKNVNVVAQSGGAAIKVLARYEFPLFFGSDEFDVTVGQSDPYDRDLGTVEVLKDHVIK